MLEYQLLNPKTLDKEGYKCEDMCIVEELFEKRIFRHGVNATISTLRFFFTLLFKVHMAAGRHVSTAY